MIYVDEIKDGVICRTWYQAGFGLHRDIVGVEWCAIGRTSPWPVKKWVQPKELSEAFHENRDDNRANALNAMGY